MFAVIVGSYRDEMFASFFETPEAARKYAEEAFNDYNNGDSVTKVVTIDNLKDNFKGFNNNNVVLICEISGEIQQLFNVSEFALKPIQKQAIKKEKKVKKEKKEKA